MTVFNVLAISHYILHKHKYTSTQTHTYTERIMRGNK